MNDHSIPDRDCAVCAISSMANKLFSCYRQFSRWLDGNAKDLAPIFLRLLLAYEFGEAGLEKLNGENWFADLTFPFPLSLLSADVIWTLATGLELIASVALILGLATRLFSFSLMLLTLVAIAAVHWPTEWHSFAELWKGYAITDQGYGNYKLPLMYVLMLCTLMLSGSGRLSVDAIIQRRNFASRQYQN